MDPIAGLGRIARSVRGRSDRPAELRQRADARMLADPADVSFERMHEIIKRAVEVTTRAVRAVRTEENIVQPGECVGHPMARDVLVL